MRVWRILTELKNLGEICFMKKRNKGTPVRLLEGKFLKRWENPKSLIMKNKHPKIRGEETRWPFFRLTENLSSGIPD